MYQFAASSYLRATPKPTKSTLPHMNSSIAKTTATIGGEDLSRNPPQRNSEQTRAAQHGCRTIAQCDSSRCRIRRRADMLKKSFHYQLDFLRAKNERMCASIEQVSERLQSSEAAHMMNIIVTNASSSVASLLPRRCKAANNTAGCP